MGPALAGVQIVALFGLEDLVWAGTGFEVSVPARQTRVVGRFETQPWELRTSFELHREPRTGLMDSVLGW